jgi:hypothetical protein
MTIKQKVTEIMYSGLTSEERLSRLRALASENVRQVESSAKPMPPELLQMEADLQVLKAMHGVLRGEIRKQKRAGWRKEEQGQ